MSLYLFRNMNSGTIKCRTLKRIRIKIAELNGLRVDKKVCPFEEDCITGTCPMCEKELERMEEEINRKIEKGEKVFIERIYEL